MNLYKIERLDEYIGLRDIYDNAVVVAKSVKAAALIHPTPTGHGGSVKRREGTWAAPDMVSAQFVGRAAAHLKEGTVVCTSFCAGWVERRLTSGSPK